MMHKRFIRIRMVLTLLSIGCLLFIILEGPIGPYVVQPATFEQSMQRWTGTLNTHNPIRITSNANFSSLNGVTAGSGTPADPWVIENWMIFADGVGSCIFITNTTDNFIIRHCSLWDAEEWFCGSGSGTACNEEFYEKYDWEVGGDAGIVLLNVTNARLEDNNCYSNGWCGIYVESSNNNTLQDNWCWDNHGYGIVIQNSVRTTLLNNNCTNVEKGIRLKTCNHTVVQYNTLWNTWIGLDIEYMYVNNCISKNRIENSKFGIVGEICSTVLMERNAFKNVWYGVFFCSAPGNVVRENSFDRVVDIISYTCFSPNENTVENNEILPNSPLFFGYFCFIDTETGSFHNWDENYLLRFMPGILGWLLFPITVFMWMINPIKRKIILPFKERIAREKQEEILRVLNVKEEYYVQLQKEHEKVIKQLHDDTLMKQDHSKGD